MARVETNQEFFERYARASFGGEPERLADFYDDSFLAAGPAGGAAFNNDDSFLAWLRDVRVFNQKSGMTSLAVESIEEEAQIGHAYQLVTVTWVSTFERTGETPIRFRISYIIRMGADGRRVAAYISHEDQLEAMRQKGLL